MFRYYLTIIGVATAIVAALNALFVPEPYAPWLLAVLTVVFVLAAFALDAVIACLTRALPKKLFAVERKRYAVSDKEKKCYDKLKIKAWKDKIPETGALLKIFDKTKVTSPEDPAYLALFLRETAYAEIMHIYSAPLGFILLLFAPGALKWTIALPVILVNFFLQIPPVLVQRYNRHRLQKLYALQLRKKARAEAAATTAE
ncbi:MAG: hypothetical protein II368_05895 [Clostridia bacterium]|nr:hypothetical protein [Clostridia bacterium]